MHEIIIRVFKLSPLGTADISRDKTDARNRPCLHSLIGFSTRRAVLQGLKTRLHPSDIRALARGIPAMSESAIRVGSSFVTTGCALWNVADLTAPAWADVTRSLARE